MVVLDEKDPALRRWISLSFEARVPLFLPTPACDTKPPNSVPKLDAPECFPCIQKRIATTWQSTSYETMRPGASDEISEVHMADIYICLRNAVDGTSSWPILTAPSQLNCSSSQSPPVRCFPSFFSWHISPGISFFFKITHSFPQS